VKTPSTQPLPGLKPHWASWRIVEDYRNDFIRWLEQHNSSIISRKTQISFLWENLQKASFLFYWRCLILLKKSVIIELRNRNVSSFSTIAFHTCGLIRESPGPLSFSFRVAFSFHRHSGFDRDQCEWPMTNDQCEFHAKRSKTDASNIGWRPYSYWKKVTKNLSIFIRCITKSSIRFIHRSTVDWVFSRPTLSFLTLPQNHFVPPLEAQVLFTELQLAEIQSFFAFEIARLSSFLAIRSFCTVERRDI